MSLRASSLLSACLQLTFHAGKAIRQIQASGVLQTVDKGGNDPCTLADLTSQRIIVASLKRCFPALTVVGEEANIKEVDSDAKSLNLEIVPADFLGNAERELRMSDVVVWVDPLDGTKGFVDSKLGAVTTLIGVTYRGKPAFGFIHEPFAPAPKTYWGGLGMGVVQCLDPNTDLGNAVYHSPCSDFTVITSLHHSSPQDINFIRSLKPKKIITQSGCGRKTLAIVRGEAQLFAFPREGTKKWDTCACEAIVTALGGHFCDMRGRNITYSPTASFRNPPGPLVTFDSSLRTQVVQQYLKYQSSV